MDKIIEYDGILWHRNIQGYYVSWKGNWKDKEERLHRYIYKKHYNNIPKGYIIHHIDFNKDNNNISNLQSMTSSDHKSLHGKGNKIWLGRKHKPESHIKMHLSQLGNKNNLGKKHSEETRIKMSISAIGRPKSLETKNKLSKARRTYCIQKRYIENLNT